MRPIQGRKLKLFKMLIYGGGRGRAGKAWIKGLKLPEMFQALYPGLYRLLDSGTAVELPS